MDIFLSVNNREEVLQIPVMPASFTISKPQTTVKFETISKGELLLIDAPKLKSISFESFFPIRDYPYIHNEYSPGMMGWDYVYKLDIWIQKKLPIRFIVTYDNTDTPINLPVAITNFEYSIKSDGDLWYSLEFTQMNLLGHDTVIPWYEEEELAVSQYEELKQEIQYLKEIVEKLANPFIYNYIDENMPDWAHAPVEAAVSRSCITGDGSGLNLDYQDLRHITMLYRAGIFDFIYNYIDENMPEWAREHVQKAVDKGYLKGTAVDGDGAPMLNLKYNDLVMLTIMGRAGVLD